MNARKLCGLAVGMLAAVCVLGCKESSSRRHIAQASEAQEQSNEALADYARKIASQSLSDKAKSEEIERELGQAGARMEAVVRQLKGYWPAEIQLATLLTSSGDYAGLQAAEALSRAYADFNVAARSWTQLQTVRQNIAVWKARLADCDKLAAAAVADQGKVEAELKQRQDELQKLTAQRDELLAQAKSKHEAAKKLLDESRKTGQDAPDTPEGLKKLAESLNKGIESARIQGEGVALDAQAAGVADEIRIVDVRIQTANARLKDVRDEDKRIAGLIATAKARLRGQTTPAAAAAPAPEVDELEKEGWEKAATRLEGSVAARLKVATVSLQTAKDWAGKAAKAYEKACETLTGALRGVEAYNRQAGRAGPELRVGQAQGDDLAELIARLDLATAYMHLAQIKCLMAANATLFTQTKDLMTKVGMQAVPGVEPDPNALQEAQASRELARAQLEKAAASPLTRKPPDPGVQVLGWSDYIRQRLDMLGRMISGGLQAVPPAPTPPPVPEAGSSRPPIPGPTPDAQPGDAAPAPAEPPAEEAEVPEPAPPTPDT